jgi:Pyridoxamine 5'-phosphate oxidase
MGRIHDAIDEPLTAWLEAQPVFFVATSPLAADGHINVSPKGNRHELAVLGPKTVAYLDQTGSGAETVAHLRENGRIVVMACAFSGPPRIVRLHGQGRVVVPADGAWPGLSAQLAARGADPAGPGARCIIQVEVNRVADSCGYGVPLMAFEHHRDVMNEWSARKGPQGIAAYQAEKNRSSIDGLPALDEVAGRA